MKHGNKTYSNHGGPFHIWTYSRGIIRGYTLSLILFLVFGLLLTFTNMGEGAMSLITTLVLILGVAYSGIYTVTNIGSRGWLHGGVAGLVFILLLVFFSKMFIAEYSLDRIVLYRILICAATGSIGGMIGINIK